MQWSFAAAAVAATLVAVPAAAEETCHAFTSQFAKERICVSTCMSEFLTDLEEFGNE